MGGVTVLDYAPRIRGRRWPPTLLEWGLVCVILAVIGAVVIPRFTSHGDPTRQTVAAQQAVLHVMVGGRAVGHRLEWHPIVAVPVQHLQLAELNHAISSLRTCVIERECAASVKREGRPWRDGPR